MPADTSSTNLAYEFEVTYGQTVGTKLKNFRYTGETLRADTSTVVSNEIKSNRRTADVIRTNLTTQGEINVEMSYGAHDDLIEAALLSTAWSAEDQTTSGDTSIAAAATGGVASNSFTGAGDEGFAHISVGDQVEVRGFATSANNGHMRVTAINSSNPGTLDNDEIVVDRATLVNEANPGGAGINITVLSAVEDGTTFRSASIEREHTDVGAGVGKFVLYNGQVFDGLSMTIAVESIITAVFNLIGKTETSASATAGDSDNTAAAQNEVLNPVDHVLAVYDDGTAIEITGLNWQLRNGHRPRNVVGTLGPTSVGKGRVAVTGQHTRFYDTPSTIFDKYNTFTASSVGFVLQDAAGNGYVIDFGRVKYTAAQRNAPAVEQDVIADMSFTAYENPDLGYTVKVARFTSTSA